jgi:hypothetical protein
LLKDDAGDMNVALRAAIGETNMFYIFTTKHATPAPAGVLKESAFYTIRRKAFDFALFAVQTRVLRRKGQKPEK